MAQAEPIESSVNIPLQELCKRLFELPSKSDIILVAGPQGLGAQAVEQLIAVGRKAVLAEGWSYGENHGQGRLWKPNAWLAGCVENQEPGVVLDLACGSGRDSVYLAAYGWEVVAIDNLPDAVELGRKLAARYLDEAAQVQIDWQVADLLSPDFDSAKRFDLIHSAFFFDRALLARAITWLKPGGHLISEAFTTIHQAQRGKPASPARVVKPGEMSALVGDLEILSLQEGQTPHGHTVRVWAGRPVCLSS